MKPQSIQAGVFAMNFPHSWNGYRSMNMQAIDLTEIKHDLATLPPDKLRRIRDFVRSMKPREKKIEALEGIWEGLGFEKIDNLEEEIRKFRRENSEQILKKFDKWNL
jgi:alanyl-tRNA synthetase